MSFSFGNPPLLITDFPDKIEQDSSLKESLLRIANYNNSHKGIIDNEFIDWSIKNKISYSAIKWFINDFSLIDDVEKLSYIDGMLNKYTIYYDESNNCLKFQFKDRSGKLNTDYTEDFVLAGIAFEGDDTTLNIETLFQELHLQKNIIDVKLKHIIVKDPEKKDKFLMILNSPKIEIVLSNLLKTPNMYIHWSAMNLLYFALADIVDTNRFTGFFHNEIKNVLYQYARKDEGLLLNLLAEYDYPNIKQEKIRDYCYDMMSWIETLVPNSEEDEFYLEFLRQELKSSGKMRELPLLTDNTSGVLIENFAVEYVLALENFPNSNHIFDEIEEIQSVLNHFISKIGMKNGTVSYKFVNSRDSKWIQLSDIIAGIMGSYFTYGNHHTVAEIDAQAVQFTAQQKRNLKLLNSLMEKSSSHNIFFDHRSNVFSQNDVFIRLREIAGPVLQT